MGEQPAERNKAASVLPTPVPRLRPGQTLPGQAPSSPPSRLAAREARRPWEQAILGGRWPCSLPRPEGAGRGAPPAWRLRRWDAACRPLEAGGRPECGRPWRRPHSGEPRSASCRGVALIPSPPPPPCLLSQGGGLAQVPEPSTHFWELPWGVGQPHFQSLSVGVGGGGERGAPRRAGLGPGEWARHAVGLVRGWCLAGWSQALGLLPCLDKNRAPSAAGGPRASPFSPHPPASLCGWGASLSLCLGPSVQVSWVPTCPSQQGQLAGRAGRGPRDTPDTLLGRCRAEGASPPASVGHPPSVPTGLGCPVPQARTALRLPPPPVPARGARGRAAGAPRTPHGGRRCTRRVVRGAV